MSLPADRVLVLDVQPLERPIDLDVRDGMGSGFSHVFRKRHPTGRRFKLAGEVHL